MSARITFGSILSSVQAAANTVTTTLDTATAVVGMASSFVQEAADNQQIRQIADKETFVESLIREKAMEEANSSISIKKFMNKSQEHAKFYQDSYTKFEELLRTEDN